MEKSGGYITLNLSCEEKEAYNKCLKIKNVGDREHYEASRIMKERVRERKNRMWEVKYKEVDSIVEGLQSTELWHFLKNLRNDCQYP